MKFKIPYLKYFRLFSGKPRKLVGVLLFETYIVIVLLFVIIGYVWVFQKYKTFKKESLQVQQNYIETQKKFIKKETHDAIDFINYKRLQTDIALKDLLKNRTNEAISIAQHIYDEYKNNKSPEEVKQLIKEALRPIRFNKGRGYYFIGTLSGVEILYPIANHNEGRNLYDLKDDMGNFVIRDEIAMVKSYGEGFCYGFWKKPGTESVSHQKISYVKLFAPYGWYIGTGEYVDDYTKDVQLEVLDRISKIRYGKEGYIFINTYDGDALITDGNLVTMPKNLWELEDPNGVKVIQDERNAVKNPEGDFIYYSWRKLTSTEIPKKCRL
jgi:signal transduction histidine kinase